MFSKDIKYSMYRENIVIHQKKKKKKLKKKVQCFMSWPTPLPSWPWILLAAQNQRHAYSVAVTCIRNPPLCLWCSLHCSQVDTQRELKTWEGPWMEAAELFFYRIQRSTF